MEIELRHIHKQFGTVHANDDVNLSIKSGRIVGILGENGAGKSTLMKILAGYQLANSGEIFLDGIRVQYHGPKEAIQHGIGMLQQDPLDVGVFTVVENFMLGFPGAFVSHFKNARERLLKTCKRFGFEIDPDMPINRLTIGQRQQLEIVRLLALGVRTLILDEPTTGISAEQKETLFNALRQLARDDSVTILLVSHKLEDVITLCHEVAILRAGKVVGATQMPATPAQLVSLMFGQELPPQFRQPQDLKHAPTTLRLSQVHLKNNRLSIDGLSLIVRHGEILGLAGLDGSGQELILRACVGLVRCQHGQIFLHDQNMTGKSYRHYMDKGAAFGAAGRLEEGLVGGLTITEHVALVTETETFVDWSRARDITQSKIKTYNVYGRPDSSIETLSGGNQQRVLMSLMPDHPLLMVLEQPTRGLDVDSSRWIWQQLLARRDKGTSIIFSSEDLDELMTYSDRILVFYAGQVFEVPDANDTSIDELGQLIGGHIQREGMVKQLA